MILTNGKTSIGSIYAGVSYLRTRRHSVALNHAHLRTGNGGAFSKGIFAIRGIFYGEEICKTSN